jgi:hypothetical protein
MEKEYCTMKLLLQILLLFLTSLISSINATLVFTKVAFQKNAVSFSKIENQKLECEVKISVQNFARSSISENSFSQKGNSWESYASGYTYKEKQERVVKNVGDDLIQLARKEFDAFGTEWKKINPHTNKDMFNTQSGGYVVSHNQHNVIIGNADSKTEFAIAEALAGDGKKVKLLSESAPVGVKTPDAEIIGEGIFDFKNVNATSESGIKTNVRDYVMNPSKRSEADGLVFNIKDNPSATPASINQGVLDAVSTVSNESNLAKKIGVVYSNGTTKIISIQEFKVANGARF